MRRSLLPPEIEPDILDIIATLDDAAERSGDRRYVRARNALAAASPGRPRVDDERLIEEAKWLLDSGQVKNLNRALLMVARSANITTCHRSFAERLRQKIASGLKKTSGK
ncbi:hypothetical protein [Aminobacter aminovorans]|uniref:hypothetical protein n=1 Tax=Aminobacter aminovorans TaxID=83263 RepID=UPI000E20A9A6|nr:hypothetical protein [Aminobacter aminovorans]